MSMQPVGCTQWCPTDVAVVAAMLEIQTDSNFHYLVERNIMPKVEVNEPYPEHCIKRNSFPCT